MAQTQSSVSSRIRSAAYTAACICLGVAGKTAYDTATIKPEIRTTVLAHDSRDDLKRHQMRIEATFVDDKDDNKMIKALTFHKPEGGVDFQIEIHRRSRWAPQMPLVATVLFAKDQTKTAWDFDKNPLHADDIMLMITPKDPEQKKIVEGVLIHKLMDVIERPRNEK